MELPVDTNKPTCDPKIQQLIELINGAKQEAAQRQTSPPLFAFFKERNAPSDLGELMLKSHIDPSVVNDGSCVPENPRAGEVYVFAYRGSHTTDKLSWTAGGWKNNHSKSMKSLYQNCGEFKKVVRRLNVVNPEYMLVWYYGDDSKAIRKPHGNTKSGHLHVPSSQTLREEMVDALNSGKSVPEAYTELNKKHQNDSHIDQPKSQKQLYYLKSKDKQQLEMNGGSLSGLISLADTWQSQGKWRIKHISLFPDFIVIYVHEHLLSVFLEMVNGTNAPENMKFEIHFTAASFDETFKCSYCYLTEGVMICTAIAERPVLAPFVILHTKKDQDTFEFIGEQLRRIIPQLKNMKVAVTDLEKSIHNGFKHAFPDTTWTFCRNHLLKAVLNKCTKLKLPADYAYAICGVGTIEGFIDKPLNEYKEGIAGLPEELKTYWMSTKDDLVRNHVLKEVLVAKNILQETDYAKITTNRSESMHHHIQSHLPKKGKTVEVHELLEIIDKVFDSDMLELQRAFRGESRKWHLSEYGKDLKRRNKLPTHAIETNPKSYSYWKHLEVLFEPKSDSDSNSVADSNFASGTSVEDSNSSPTSQPQSGDAPNSNSPNNFQKFIDKFCRQIHPHPRAPLYKSDVRWTLQSLTDALEDSGILPTHASHLANDALARAKDKRNFRSDGYNIAVKSKSDPYGAFYDVDFSQELPICRNPRCVNKNDVCTHILSVYISDHFEILPVIKAYQRQRRKGFTFKPPKQKNLTSNVRGLIHPEKNKRQLGLKGNDRKKKTKSGRKSLPDQRPSSPLQPEENLQDICSTSSSSSSSAEEENFWDNLRDSPERPSPKAPTPQSVSPKSALPSPTATPQSEEKSAPQSPQEKSDLSPKATCEDITPSPPKASPRPKTKQVWQPKAPVEAQPKVKDATKNFKLFYQDIEKLQQSSTRGRRTQATPNYQEQ